MESHRSPTQRTHSTQYVLAFRVNLFIHVVAIVWGNIEGKLRKALEDLKQERVVRATDQRKFERETQLRQLYTQWLQITDPKDGPYPTIEEFLLLPAVLNIRDGNTPQLVIDQDLFDEAIGPPIHLFTASLRATMAKALRVELYGGDEEDTDEDSDDILYYATSLFTSPNLSMFNFRASELISFDELLLKLPQHSRGVAGTRSRIRDACAGPERVFRIGTARAILNVLGLPENTPYDEVTDRIVCLCGKPGFTQPTSFADLVGFLSLPFNAEVSCVASTGDARRGRTQSLSEDEQHDRRS